jgi:D-alanyl-D-alanine carboxypeptidase
MKSTYILLITILFTFISTIAQNTTNKNMTTKEKAMQTVLDKSVDGKKVFGTSFAIKANDSIWFGAAGDLTIHQPFFIASTTKLFTTALILKLESEGKLKLEDKINKYLETSVMAGLHVYKNKDYANEITIKHLLAHTSGLPDYFQNKGANGKSLEDEIAKGEDQFWTFYQAIERTKTLQPLFAPGTKNKAHYSDANFQLLGKIIETITNKSYSENCNEYIIKPLGLANNLRFCVKSQ